MINYSVFHKTLDSLFEIPEVQYEIYAIFITLLPIKSRTWKQSCEFHDELCWEVAKFVAS